MGVGNFRGSFESVGKIVSVQQTYFDEEAFEAHKAAYVADYGEECETDYEDFQRESSFAEWEQVISLVQTATENTGTVRATADLSHPARPQFDDAFMLIASGDLLDVGIHDYHGTTIFAVSPAGELTEWAMEPECHEAEIISRFGMSPERFAEKISALSEAVADTARLAVQANGFETTYRTSAWTSGTYEKLGPDETAEATAALHAEIVALVAELKSGPSATMIASDETFRKSAFEAARNDRAYAEYHVATFVYDVAGDRILAFDYSEDRPLRRKLPDASHELMDLLRNGAADEEYTALPAGTERQAFFEAVATENACESCWILPVGADEVARWVDEDLELTIGDYVYAFGGDDEHVDNASPAP